MKGSENSAMLPLVIPLTPNLKTHPSLLAISEADVPDADPRTKAGQKRDAKLFRDRGIVP